jgi:hypothetical protein
VTVDLNGVPAEGLELGAHVAGIHDLLGRAVGLQVVVVDDRRQVRQLVVCRRHRPLPTLPLLAVAVGHQGEDLGSLRQAVETEGETNAHAHREALAERPGRDLNPGCARHVRMALQVRADLAQPHQVVGGEVAVLGERRIQDRRGVALGEDEAVALGPARVPGIVAEDPVVEGGDDVGRRERAVQVPCLRDRNHADTVHAEHGRIALELGDGGLALALAGGLWLEIWDGLQVRHRGLIFRLVVGEGWLGSRLTQDRAARVAAGGTGWSL